MNNVVQISPRILSVFLDGSKSQTLSNRQKEPVFELRNYSHDVPYHLEIQTMHVYNFMHLHYADSLEILLTQKLRGYVIVAGKKKILDDSPHVLIFMPGVLHTGYFEATDPITHDGLVYCLQFSIDNLSKTLSIDTIMGMNNRKVSDLGNSTPSFSVFLSIVKELIDNDSDVWKRTRICLDIFELLANAIPDDVAKKDLSLNEPNLQLNKLISWSHAHIGDRITVDDAASYMHLSRYYFCHYFKKQTGITYLQYLNQLRYQHVVQMLQSGCTTTECCYECGFTNLSYFTQWFKNISGKTTSQMRDGL